MTGPCLSVLGVKPELAVAKMKDKLPVRFHNAEGPCIMSGVVLTWTMPPAKPPPSKGSMENTPGPPSL